MDKCVVNTPEQHSKEIPTVSRYAALRQLEVLLATHAPFLKKSFQSRFEEFGDAWALKFDTELAIFFGQNQERLALAARGYASFALDAIKLQKQFNQTHEYIHKNYSDLLESVYLNRTYMFDLYLPGILLSQYLWPHHYRQLEFFLNRFVPLIKEERASLFYDIGVGTGFYSKEMLRALPEIRGCGIDISPHSLEHARSMVESWGLSSRYEIKLQNIFNESWRTKADALINVEVLEHLENPQDFLRALHGGLKDDGLAFITAAVNAPNCDHIYLYRSLRDVMDQVCGAGFKVLDAVEYVAYEAIAGEIAPSSAVLILRKAKL